MLGSNKSNSENLHRLARFGANIADAYGCYIFLRYNKIFGKNNSAAENQALNNQVILCGYHSLSNDVIANCKIEVGHGLIGWVAKHKRSIHVSPFERDSRTLGLYFNDQSLKSFIGIPVYCDTNDEENIAGVVACDSKKSFAFSKLQGKLLEDLACEISFHLKMTLQIMQSTVNKNSWHKFISMTNNLSASIGRDSLEIFRIKLENFYELEKTLGSGRALAMTEQVYKLIEQSIPPQFPFLRLSNGDMLLALDNMMTSLIENKIAAFCEYCAASSGAAMNKSKTSVLFSFHKEAAGNRKNKGLTLEELVQTTSDNLVTAANATQPNNQTNAKRKFGLIYEYKRA